MPPARHRRVLAAGVSVAIATTLATIGSLFASGSVAHAADTGTRRVVVVLVDRTTAAMLQSVPGIQQMDSIGASGLMVVRTGPGRGGRTRYAAVTSLSSGAPAVTPPDQRSPTVTGAATGSPSLVPVTVPGLAALRRANAAATVAAVPGLLGQTLRAHGIVAAAIGDSDLPGRPNRPAAFLAMDESGAVPLGAMSSTDMAPPSGSALPVITNLQAMEQLTRDALAKARFVVVDWGDSTRADELLQQPAATLARRGSSGFTLGSRLQSERTTSLARLGDYLQALPGVLDSKRDLVIVTAANPPASVAAAGVATTPILLAGKGYSGSLTSSTTGIRGVVSGMDFAPTILHWLRIPIPSLMRGHSMSSNPAGLGLTAAVTNERSYERVARQRNVVLLGVALVWLAAVALSLLVVERRGRQVAHLASRDRKKERPKDLRFLESSARWLVFSAAFTPLAILLQPKVSSGATGIVALEVLGTTLLAGFLIGLACRHRALVGLGAIGIMTLVAYLADQSTGASLSTLTLAGPTFLAVGYVSRLDATCAGACLAAGLFAAGAMARGARATPWLRWFWIVVTAIALTALAAPPLRNTVALPVAGILGLATLGVAGLRKPVGRRIWIEVGTVICAALLIAGVVLVIADAAFARNAAAADRAPTHVAAAALSLGGHALATWGHFLFFTWWTLILVVAIGAIVYVDGLLRGGPWSDGPRSMALATPDRNTQACVAGMVVTAAVALVVGVHGPPSAAVVMMGAALLFLSTAAERTRHAPH
jgi:hypothetical protein